MADPEMGSQGGVEESKEDRFKRLAESRVNNAVAKIGLIGNLASNNYGFTAEQVDKIMNTIKTTVDELETKFQKALNKKGFNDKGKFKL